MPNFGYHLARLKRKRSATLYRALLPLIVHRRLNPARSIRARGVFLFRRSHAAGANRFHPLVPSTCRSAEEFHRRFRRFARKVQHSVASNDVDPSVTVQLSIQPPPGRIAAEISPLSHDPSNRETTRAHDVAADRMVLHYTSIPTFFSFTGAVDLVHARHGARTSRHIIWLTANFPVTAACCAIRAKNESR